MYGTAQEIEHTTSRWSAPRKWLTAIRWLIGAGLHPKANATTQRVADDLAARMDYSTGHVRYGLAGMVERLGIGRSQLCEHIKYLRELGALVWAVRGSQSNVRRVQGQPGYARTATVYAAVIPPSYDQAMGHTVIGSGYTARIIIDQRGQATQSVDTPGNTAVDNSSSEAHRTPSLTCVEEEGKLKVEGRKENYTSQQAASRDRASIPGHRSNNSGGSKSGRHALQVAEDIRIARQVRPLVNWTQRVPLRPLAYCLRPLIDRGLDAYGIAAYLNGLCTGERWRPRRPAAYIRTVLADRQQADQKRAAAVERFERENPIPGAFQASPAVQQSLMAALEAGIARYQQQMRARGHDDLCTPHLVDMPAHTDADAAADFAAFLGTNTVPTPAF